MALKFPASFRTTRANTVTTRAGNGALLRIYDGTRATDADTAIGAQVKLAELTCASPFAPGASSGVLTASAITTANALATGTATWFRLTDSAGTTTIMDGSVSATGGGGDLQLVTASIVSTQPVQITSFVFTEGGA